MTGQDEAAVRAAVAAGAERLRDAGRGLLHVCGPAGSGRTAVLAGIAAADPEAVLIDAAGRTMESVVAELADRTGLLRRRPDGGWPVLRQALLKEKKERTLLIANAERAGRYVDGYEPVRLQALIDGLAAATRQGRLRLVVEQTRTPELPAEPSPKYWEDVLRLTDGQGPEELRALEAALPSDAVAAVRALANARLRRVPLDGWAALCKAAQLPVAGRQLTDWAADPRWVVQDADGVGVKGPALAEALRYPAEQSVAFHARMTERLLAAEPADWAARSLPGHAAAAGKFEELLADARALARIPQDALVDGLQAAYRDGEGANGGRAAEHGTRAAELSYLAGYGLAGAPHGEWVARLAHDACTRGQFDRAETLAAASPEPLLFRTAWAHWRPNGEFAPPIEPWHRADVCEVVAAEYRGAPAVLTEDEDGIRFVRDAATGELLGGPFTEDPEDLRRTGAATLTVRPAVRRTEVLDPDADAEAAKPLGTFHHPDAERAGAVGELLVLADVRGAYAVRLDPTRLDPHPRQPATRVGRYVRLRARHFDPAALPPLPDLLARTFGAERLHRIDPVPDGIADASARELLATVGLPSVESRSGYWLAPDQGLPARPWSPWPGAEQPPGAGPFHLIGGWVGADLVLDGADGRVLRMIPADWPERALPREPLIGTGLHAFLTMVALQQQYLTVYRPGELDRAELLAELAVRLAGVDPAAVATDSWQHVLEPDTWA
ncbi:SUKH-4 family immunity protein [Streptomyces sp. TLI_171]|uniref:SUKH-4 family immunity protein n=1 Tax=Streptomyces sp. TLI_171 TaxID=1938859 RepID=UPI000C18C621|nr:SUKH-4 family immunity protein [Streptomyces sp. TLI_171]RKE23291.1 SUKH-4 immunity protein of toxin-antitoxin system [Streptomyces sp. TLI_171]